MQSEERVLACIGFLVNGSQRPCRDQLRVSATGEHNERIVTVCKMSLSTSLLDKIETSKSILENS